ncbi:MAG: hypothetical protein JWL64_2100 [Frankiales bacterium]|nr:hypothetical protein [Frankiales bacterium]
MLGLNHPLKTLLAREAVLGFRFPVVGGVYYTFDTVWARHLAELRPAYGRQLMVCWMPQRWAGPVSLADVAAGAYDLHLDQMLSGMRAWPGPVVCRWGHEPNGNWYPWSATYAGVRAGSSSPRDYVAAWRHIVGRERRIPGTSNITWFWCASGVDRPGPDGRPAALEEYWPGEEWVDLAGCDAYNEPNVWQSFDEVLSDPYRRISRLTSKPFWIGEVGCHEPLTGQPGTKSSWFDAMLRSAEFPRLQAVCYFDYDVASEGRADWRLDSTPATLEGIVQALGGVPVRA